jgi:hypothetical protein
MKSFCSNTDSPLLNNSRINTSDPKNHSSVTASPRHSKITNLHKMLDSEIRTVNALFSSHNAFEQIESKLKVLEIKLNSIKEEEDELQRNNCKPQK